MAAAQPAGQPSGATPYEVAGQEKLNVTNAELCAKWFLEERAVPIKGRGVFPTRPIPAGELIIKFEGPVYDKTTMAEEKDFSEAIQVGVNGWMWSSGGLDDLVNHSCNPNCGLWQRGGDTFLWTLRPIAADEELSFDYSTSMMDEPWSMDCACGEAACRGVIANSLDMPRATLEYYASMDTLPEHVWVAAAQRGIELHHGVNPTAATPSKGAPIVPKQAGAGAGGQAAAQGV